MKAVAALETAKQRFAAGELDEARRQVETALALNNETSDAQLLRLQIIVESGGGEAEVLAAVAAGLMLAPTDARFYYYQGLFYERRGATPRALEAYQTAARLDANTLQYQLAAAEMLIEAARLDEAENYLREARRQHPNAAGVVQEQGYIAQIRGDYRGAAQHFADAATLAPDAPELWADLAIAWYRAGEYAQALPYFERLNGAAARPEWVMMQAECYLKNNRPVEARALLRQLLRQPGQNENYGVWTMLTEAAWLLHDTSSWRRSAEKMIRLKPQQEDGYLALARYWQEQHELPKARATLARYGAVPSPLFGEYKTALAAATEIDD
jgi:tetratricopeptide (TPR) repeat protein